MIPKIRFIVCTYTAVTPNGTFSYAHVLSTVSGRRLYIQSTGKEADGVSLKIKEILKEAGQDHEYPTVYCTYHEMGIREWKRGVPTAGYWMPQVTKEVIFDLEEVREIQL